MLRRVLAAVLSLVALVGGSPAQAVSVPGPAVVRDINIGPQARFGSSAVAAGMVFFTKIDSTRHELWRTDGTPSGTVRLARFHPGINELTDGGDHLLFSADDGSHGRELWRSDGTAAGTVLVDDLVPGGGGSNPANLAAVGADVFFAVTAPTAGLWRSDGTADGTALVQAHTDRVLELTDNSGVLFFWTSGATRITLRRSDGTAAGTVPVRSWPNFDGEVWIENAVASAGQIFFGLTSPGGGSLDIYTELWRSDGTAAGTRRLTTFTAGMNEDFAEEDGSTSDLVASGTDVFFGFYGYADDRRAYGGQLWRSDGTVAGTLRVRFWASSVCRPRGITAVGGQLWFAAGTKYCELWRSDGTDDGTELVADIAPLDRSSKPRDLTTAGGAVFFTADDGAQGRELWASDPSGATALMADINPSRASSFPATLAPLSGELVLNAFTYGSGTSVWRSDGSPVGTRAVGLVDPRNEGARPTDLTRLGAVVVFVAGRTRFSEDRHLWRSDGTAAGTVPTARTQREETPPRQLTVAGQQVFYTNNYAELWRSDGTSSGLVRSRYGFCGGLRTLTAVGERLFFSGFRCEGSKGRELWTSDGTAAGTTLVKDINPGKYKGSTPADMASVGRRLYFSANDGVHGRELWRSNGTSASTRLVKDIRRGGNRSDSSPTEPTRAGSITFFAAADGVHGRELWRTDGTAAGTRRVRDIRPGGRGSVPQDLTNVGGVLVFTAGDGVHGRELWRSDGTRAGTTRVADIRPGAHGSTPRSLTAVGPRLFFTADDGVHGRDLWTSQGTPVSTKLVNDSPATEAGPTQLTNVRGTLVFADDDGTHGREIWSSDGTPAGTTLIADFHPRGSSNPNSFTLLNDTLLFSGGDGTNGVELAGLPWPP